MAGFEALLGGGQWESRIVTYSFETAAPVQFNPAYMENIADLGFRPLGATEQTMMRQAFQQWSVISALTLIEVDPGYGDIRVSDLDLQEFINGVGNFPSIDDDDVVGGDIYFDIDGISALTGGDPGFLVYVMSHEIGHALGLTHSFADYPGDIAISPSLDSTRFTVMSDVYVPGTQGPQVFDEEALNFLYGYPDVEYASHVIIGSADGDSLTGEIGTVTNVILGGAGGDTLTGAEVSDLLKGEDGGDTLIGNDGDDSLDGGRGIDMLDGGAGFDWLRGGFDDDTLIGGDGNDRLSGNEGSDLLQGGNHSDLLLGGDGDDSIDGGRGSDILLGGAGNDILIAGTETLEQYLADQQFLFDPIADDLSGGDGDDTLTGGFGKDRLEGGAGNDVIDGGPIYASEAPPVTIFVVPAGDRAVFSGFVEEYSFAAGANGAVIVTDLRDLSPDGIDTVTNVDRLEFADGSFRPHHLVNPAGNAAPIALDDQAVLLLEDYDLYGAVVIADTNDSDPDGDPLTARIATGPANGRAYLSGGQIIYESNESFTGTDTFTYEISDGLDISQATVTVSVVRKPPPIGDIMDEDGTLLLPDVGTVVQAFDFEGNVTGEFTITGYGSDAIDGVTFDELSGDYIFTPQPNYYGQYQILVLSQNADGMAFHSPFYITVNQINDAPLIINPATDQVFDEGAAVEIILPEDIFADSLDPPTYRTRIDEYTTRIDPELMTISATLADGSVLPAWLTYNFRVTDTFDEAYAEETGGIRFIIEYDYGFTGAAPADFDGSLDIMLTATDRLGAAVTDTFVLTINGDVAPNEIVGTSGNDRGATGALQGGAGRDHIDALSGNDQLYGFGGDDILLGGKGNDTLAGGSGNDTLTGGAGNDIFAFSALTASANELSVLLGDDLVTDFADGNDRIDVSGLGLAWRNADADLDDGFAIVQNGSDVVITVLDQGTLTLANTALADIGRGDFFGFG